MSAITVFDNVTLDGVMQGPARPDEDTRGGFTHGGWARDYEDDVKRRAMGSGRAAGGALLFGRRTYEDFANVWPGREPDPIAETLGAVTKYVVSSTLAEPLEWRNSRVLDGIDAVAELLAQPDTELTILGSGVLISSLMERGLIDRFVLLIHPLILGSGRRLFADGVSARLELVSSTPTNAGVLIATYRRVGAA